MNFKPAFLPEWKRPVYELAAAVPYALPERELARGVRTVLLSDPLSLNAKEMSRRKCQVLAINSASVKEFTKLNNSDP
jgi:hypothetical protein